MKIRDLISELLVCDMDQEVLLMTECECLVPVSRVANVGPGRRPVLQSAAILEGSIRPHWRVACKNRRD